MANTHMHSSSMEPAGPATPAGAEESLRRELELLAWHLDSCDRSRGRWPEGRRLAQAAGGMMAGRIVTTAFSAAGVVLAVMWMWPGIARV